MASEIIREKLFRSLGEEPFIAMVEIDKFEQTSKFSRILQLLSLIVIIKTNDYR